MKIGDSMVHSNRLDELCIHGREDEGGVNGEEEGSIEKELDDADRHEI